MQFDKGNLADCFFIHVMEPDCGTCTVTHLRKTRPTRHGRGGASAQPLDRKGVVPPRSGNGYQRGRSGKLWLVSSIRSSSYRCDSLFSDIGSGVCAVGSIQGNFERAMAEKIDMEDGKPSNGEPLTNGLSSPKERDPEPLAQRVKRIVMANLLVILTVAGVIIGVFIGLGVRNVELSQTQKIYVGFPGELLIRLLKMIIIPLVVCSLVSGSASLDPKALGKLGGWAMLFFLVTTLIASSIGVVMAFIITPGAVNVGMPKVAGLDDGVPAAKEVIDSFLDLIRCVTSSIVPLTPGQSPRHEESLTTCPCGLSISDF